MRSILRFVLTVLLLVPAATACAGSSRTTPQKVSIQVTSKGFVPARVTVRAGRPVTLLVTRRTDRTCAKELVMPAQKIHQALPLNETVAITFTPTEAGELAYACGMDMIKGVVMVQPVK